MRNILLTILWLCFACGGSAQTPDLLGGKFSAKELQAILIPASKWTPFPRLADRTGWAKADKAALDAIVKSAEEFLGYEWPTIPATMSLMYVRTGDRNKYQEVSFRKRNVLRTLIVAEVADNRGRFIDDIINGVWAICEESWWGVPAHLPTDRDHAGLMDVTQPFVDLFAAETGTALAWADYFFGDKFDAISPQIRKRIHYEVETRLMAPLMKRHHSWMTKTASGRGPNNWNPWICSNWMNFVLLLEKDDKRRAEMMHKILLTLDEFLNPYPADGGCDEGPSYWGAAAASLFDNIALLNLASGDAFKYVYSDERFKNMGRFIYRAQISEKYFLNFADAGPNPGINAPMVYRYGKAIGDDAMMKFGAYYRQANVSVGGHFFRTFFALFLQEELMKASQGLPLPKDVWLPDLQVMSARDREGSTAGFYLAAKGGHNDESHNHNDIGSYVVYYDGSPLLVDIGSGTYTARTFSSKRYDIWFNCSDYHNLPTVNSATQSAGHNFKASDVRYKSSVGAVEFSLDISSAYPSEAGIQSWTRTLSLKRGKGVTIRESTSLKRAEAITEYFMTCYPVEILKAGEVLIKFAGKDGKAIDFALTYNPSQWSATVEQVALSTEEDAGIRRNWGDAIRRINLKAISPKTKDTYSFEIKKK
ncbi:MAG: heparinase II/III-family protein [Tannerellaceae bacterium]|nr:heparinase II/III-family protein [Tannerellaceae bacterium]